MEGTSASRAGILGIRRSLCGAGQSQCYGRRVWRSAADLPTALVVGIFLLPLPYNVVAVVGVWRSADTYNGPRHWATLARVAAVAWSLFMIAI